MTKSGVAMWLASFPTLDRAVQRGFGDLEGLANLPHRVKVVGDPQSKAPKEALAKQQ